MRVQTTKWVRWLMLLAILLGLYGFLSQALFAFADQPFDSDEAVHALDGLEIAADVYHLNGLSLLKNLYFVRWYPPLLSVYLAPFFLLVGPSTWVARYAVLLTFFIYLALVYAAAKKLYRLPSVGIMAVLLLATSPVLWVQSLLVMEEMLAFIFLLLAVLAFCAGNKPTLTGLLLSLTLLAKLPVGIYAAAALFLALWISPEPLAIRWRRTWQTFLPFGLVALLWWAHPAKIRDFLEYVRASPPAYETWSLAEIVHHGQLLITTYSVSPVVGVGVVATLVLAIWRWRDVQWRAPWLMVMVTWAAMILKRQLSTRFFMTAVPLALLLGGVGLVIGGRWLYQRLQQRRVTWLAWVLLALFVVQAMGYVRGRVLTFPLLLETSYETDLQANAAYDWIGEKAVGKPIFLVNGWDQFSTAALEFHLAIKEWPAWEKPRVVDVYLLRQPDNEAALQRFVEAVQAHETSVIVHLGNAPVPEAGAWDAYQAAIAGCWQGDASEQAGYWLHIWDGRVETETLARPFLYTGDSQPVREQYWYNLLLEITVTPCQWP